MGGLIRLGWQLPALTPSLALAHGPLMISGFLGTLITLERAVATQKVDVPAPASFWTGMAGYCPHAFASTGTDPTYNRQSRRRRHSDRDDSP